MPAPERAKSHWLLYFTFQHGALSNVSSNGLPVRMHSHIGCICLAFPHCAFSNVFLNDMHGKMHSHIGCIFLAFLHCVFSQYRWKYLPEKNQHVFFQFTSTGCRVTAQVAAVGLISTMLNYVHFEIFFHFEGEITLRTWKRGVFSFYFHGWLSGTGFYLFTAAKFTIDWSEICWIWLSEFFHTKMKFQINQLHLKTYAPWPPGEFNFSTQPIPQSH